VALEGIPIELQQITLQGKILADHLQLKQQGIKEGTLIDITMGGNEQPSPEQPVEMQGPVEIKALHQQQPVAEPEQAD